MKAARLRGAGLCAALILGIPPGARETTPTTVATATPIAGKTGTLTPAQAQTPEAPPADGGLMKPAPTPRGSRLAPHPLSVSDCAGDGWQEFTAPPFDSKDACEGWVLEHLRARFEHLPPGDAREFRFPQHSEGGGAILRTGLPLLI